MKVVVYVSLAAVIAAGVVLVAVWTNDGGSEAASSSGSDSARGTLGDRPRIVVVPSGGTRVRTGRSDDQEVAAGADAPSPETPAEELHRKVVEPFEAEPREPRWAARWERDLAAQVTDFVAARSIAGVSVDDVDCRATRCRVGLRYDDGALAVRLQQDLIARRVLEMQGCALHSLGLAPADERGVTQTLVFACPDET